MRYFYDAEVPSVFREDGFAVLWAHAGKRQGGLPKAKAAWILREACRWLNGDALPDGKQEGHLCFPRSFKEVVLDLAGASAIKGDLRLIKRRGLDKAETAVFVGDTDPDEERCAMLTVMRDGSAVIGFTATAEQLAAIAAACQELAAGRKEEA